MRYSDQTNATTALMSNATIGGSGLIRRFAGNKISKIRFLHDQSEPTNRFITGSWNSVGHGNLTLWTVRQGATVFGRDEGEEIERSSRIELGQTDVNDLCVINAQQFVTATVSGEVRIVDCPLDETNGNSVGLAQMSTMATYARVHKNSASTALCVLNNEIFSGSDSGQIARIQPASSSSQAVRPFARDLMGVSTLTTCGPFHLVSAHTTGQLHLWDIRIRSMGLEFGMQPVVSRPVTALNHAITALATHPAQNSVIAFGSQDGVVSFIDIRQTNQLLPIAFKVSQDPINQIKFHPIFANNCFSSSNSGLIHWDASALAREVNPQSVLSGVSGQDPELVVAMMEEDSDNEHKNIWLSSRASTSVNLRVLIEEEPRLLSSFDVVQGAIVAGSHTAELVHLSGINFTN